MRGKQIALLGSMLLLAGALAGCVADPADSDDDNDDVVSVQNPLEVAPPATPPNGAGDHGRLDERRRDHEHGSRRARRQAAGPRAEPLGAWAERRRHRRQRQRRPARRQRARAVALETPHGDAIRAH